MRIGIHVSTSGGLHKAALKAVELGATTFQIFSASPRTWYAPTPDPAAIRELCRLREQHDLAPMVIHDNYLINLASRDPVIRANSIRAFRGEIVRALAIGADYLVAHPGCCMDQSLDSAMAAVSEGIAESVSGIDTRGLKLLLENTAGQGSSLGSRLNELAVIRQLSGRLCDLTIGYCLDTCHLLASGYDIVTPRGWKKTLATIDEVLGLEHVPVMHVNDSKYPLGSRVDRHANIGEGHIGSDAFRRILRTSSMRRKAFILETPVDAPGDDVRNIETLRRLAAR